MSATTLVGLYFVCDICGPTGGVVAGHANHETMIVRLLSEQGEPVRYVATAVAVGWDFYKTQTDAERAFGKLCKEALWV